MWYNKAQEENSMNKNIAENYDYISDKEIDNLKQQCDYYYLFNLTENATDLLSQVISKKEDKEYLCRCVEYKCMEHCIYEYTEPYMDSKLIEFNGELIRIEDYHSEKEKEIIIPEKQYVYLIIYDKENEKFLKQFEFQNEAEMKKIIDKYTIFNVECRNYIMSSSLKNREKKYIADIKEIEKSFPYLKYLIFEINQWRVSNMRMLPDENVIRDSISKVYKKECIKLWQ